MDRNQPQKTQSERLVHGRGDATQFACGEEELPPGGFRGDEELPPGGFRGDEELPPGGFRGDEELPPGGFRG